MFESPTIMTGAIIQQVTIGTYKAPTRNRKDQHSWSGAGRWLATLQRIVSAMGAWLHLSPTRLISHVPPPSDGKPSTSRR